MAAGLGFKTFTTGEVLTAADTNGYLMQGVLVFASAAARSAAITSPQEGQVSFLKDTNSTEYYDGAAWTSLVPASTSFSSMLNPKVVGSYSANLPAASTSGVLTAARTFYAAVFITSGSFDRIAVRTTAAHSGTSTVRLGLYNASLTTGLPTTVVFDAGTVACSAASTTYTITITQTPATGWYYLAANPQTVTGTASFQCNTDAPMSVLGQGTGLALTNSSFYEAGITGAFATAGTLVAVTQVPVVGLRNA